MKTGDLPGRDLQVYENKGKHKTRQGGSDASFGGTTPGILVKSVDLHDYKGVEFWGSDKERQGVRNFLRQKELVVRGKLGLTGNSDARQLVEIQKLGTVGVRSSWLRLK